MLKALWALVAVLSLSAGCAGAQTQGAVPLVSNATAVSKDVYSGNLLYVSEDDQGAVEVFTDPGGQLVQTLTISGPWGLCSDSNGDVFIPSLATDEILEYRHGAKRPFQILQAGGRAESCSVDPTTGNLAVVWYDSEAEGVGIFPNASGSPTNYYAPWGSVFWYCGYDGSGNLFIDGEGQSQFKQPMWELPAGSSQLLTIDFPHQQFDGGTEVQWDGQYITVQTSYKTISRLAFSSQGGTLPDHITGNIVGVTTYENCVAVGQSWIQGSTLIVPCESIFTKRWGVHGYAYPQGGEPSKHFLHAGKRLVGKGPFEGVTVSVPPSY